MVRETHLLPGWLTLRNSKGDIQWLPMIYGRKATLLKLEFKTPIIWLKIIRASFSNALPNSRFAPARWVPSMNQAYLAGPFLSLYFLLAFSQPEMSSISSM